MNDTYVYDVLGTVDSDCPNAPHEYCYHCISKTIAKARAEGYQSGVENEHLKGTNDDHAEYVLAQINADLRQRIAELEAWARLAPHARTCPTHQSYIVDDGPGNRPRRVVPDCTCWKTQALKESNE